MKLKKNIFYQRKNQIILISILVFLLFLKTLLLSNEPLRFLEKFGFYAKNNTAVVIPEQQDNQWPDSRSKSLYFREKINNIQQKPESKSSQIAIENAVETIRREVEHAFGIVNKGNYENVNNNPWYKYLVTLSAMNYVQSRLSPYIYGDLLKKNPQELPSNTETALVSGAGICGNHIQAFIDLLRMFDLRARPVEFYYKNSDGKRVNHIGAEVFYNNHWNYIDVTYGTFFRKSNTNYYDLLAIDEILKLDNYQNYKITNEANLLFQVYPPIGATNLEYLTARERDIVVNGQGTIKPDLIALNGLTQYTIKNIPLHFGTFVTTAGDLGNLKYLLNQVNNHQKELIINIKANACNTGKIRLSTQSKKKLIDISTIKPGKVKLSIASLSDSGSPILLEAIPNNKDQPCYLTFDAMEIR